MADSPIPKPSRDRLDLREIERKLTAELDAARAQLLAASTDEQRSEAQKTIKRALKRFTDFVTRGVVP